MAQQRLLPSKSSPGDGAWREHVLHRFGLSNGDGTGPFAGLIIDAAGNLYGTTESGGVYKTGGTVYQLSPEPSGEWKETILHSFAVNYRDGHTPGWGTLAMDAAGSLYGTTAGGGCCGGVVFRLTLDADGNWKETILYEFQGGTRGFEAGAGVVLDRAGNLYGTTIAGGSDCDCGVVYKLAAVARGKWKYTVLHTFRGYDGAQPDANLIIDDQGNLYGTAATGGTYDGGVVFEILATPSSQ
ncbi:MAG TPA: choice-of-anchor tandem repeat GloVer-containing protein [Terriglobales bacterium]